MFGNHLHLFLLIHFVNLFCFAHCEIPRVVLCVNPSCTEPISKAQGKILYSPSEANVLGFKRGTPILITSKSKEKDGYWGAQIGNQRGFVPSSYVKEITVWKSNDQLIEVPMNMGSDNVSGVGGESLDLDNDNTIVETKLNNENIDQIAIASEMGHQTIPLANLIHGNIPSVSKEYVQPEANMKPQTTIIPEPTVVNIETLQTPLHTATVDNDNNDDNDDENENEDEEVDAEDDSSNIEDLEDSEMIDKMYNASDVLPVVNSENLAVKKETNEHSRDTVQTLDNSVGSSSVNSVDSNLNIEESPSSGENFQGFQGIEVKESREGSTVINSNSVESNHNLDSGNENDPKDSTIDYNNTSYDNGESISVKDGNNQSFFSNYSSDDSTSIKNETDPHSLNRNKLNDSHADSGDLSFAADTAVDDGNESSPKHNNQLQQDNVKSSYLPSTTQIPNGGNKVDFKLAPGSVPYVNTQGNTVSEESVKSTNINDGINIGTFVRRSSAGSVGSSGGKSVEPQSNDGSGSNNLDDDYSVNSGTSRERVQVESSVPDSTEAPNIWLSKYGDSYDAKATPNEFVYDRNPSESGHVPSHQLVPNPGPQPETNSDTVPQLKEWGVGEETTTLSPYSPDDKNEAEALTKEAGQVTHTFSEEVVVQTENYEIPPTSEDVTELPEKAATKYFDSSFSIQNSGHVPSPLDSETAANNDETGFFSRMSETVLGWMGVKSKQTEPDTVNSEQPHVVEEKYPTSGMAPEKNQMVSDGECNKADSTSQNCGEFSSGSSDSSFNFWREGKSTNFTSNNTLMYLIVTAITVLLFTLGYYFIEQFRNDGPLIAKVNKLEQELLVSSKECHILKDELTSTKEKLNLFETSSNDKIITALQSELEDSKKIRTELENNIEILQQELETATEAGLDLNRMLSEVLTQKGGSESLMASVEHLQQQLNDQQKIIDDMTSKLIAKTQENQELQDDLAAASEKIESLESEMEDMRGNLNVHLKDNEDVIRDLTSKNKELQLKMNHMNDLKEKEVSKLKKSHGELEKKLKSITDSLKVKEEECNNLKDSIRKIKIKDLKNLDTLFDASRMKAELAQSESENKTLKDQLKVGEDRFAKLESTVKKLEDELEKWRQCSSEAEKEKMEAQTRLEVLSNYFKEKETQLQKELGLREAQWVQKQGDDSTVYEHMKSLKEEIDNYKSQNEALKKEILDQERGLKIQITTLEKKAHENWIAARQAERKLEESKQEAGQLRNKLTLMEKNITNDLESGQHHRNTNEELNGGEALSPLIHDTSSPILFPPLPLDPNSSSLMPPGFIPPPLFMPPPPGGFMPPPPPFLPGDHRPPPLGRMSSPPLNSRFSPPPPDYAYDRMSTPPLSPSNRNYRSPNESDRERDRYRHRTPTSPSFRGRNWEEGPSGGIPGFRPISSERDIRRDHKGGSNLSSGHSSESLDKSSRHSGRV